MAKTKALISFAVTAKLICVFVFAYAKNRFSHDEPLFISMVSISLTKSYLSTGQVSMRIVVALIYTLWIPALQHYSSQLGGGGTEDV